MGFGSRWGGEKEKEKVLGRENDSLLSVSVSLSSYKLLFCSASFTY